MAKKKQNKKKRRLAINSDPSDNNSLDGSITPQAYTVRRKNHQGGDYSDAECIWSVNPPITGHESPVNQAPVNQSPVNQSLVSQSPVNQSPVNQALVNQAPGSLSLVNQALVNQSPVTGHGSPVTGHPVTGHSVITRHRPPITRHRAFNHQAPVTVNQSLVNLPGVGHHAAFDGQWTLGSQSIT